MLEKNDQANLMRLSYTNLASRYQISQTFKALLRGLFAIPTVKNLELVELEIQSASIY